MSLVTNFNHKAFGLDKNRENPIRKEAVSLSILTTKEMRRLGVVTIKTKVGNEYQKQPWAPIVTKNGEERPTFWDTRMGNFSGVRGFDNQPCQTCQSNASDQTNERCTGHFGLIEMPVLEEGRMVVYNPVTFHDLQRLLRAKCFWCHQLRASATEILKWRLIFDLFDAGLVGEAIDFQVNLCGSWKPKQRPQAAAPMSAEEKMTFYVNELIADARAKGKVPKDPTLFLRTVIDIRTQLVTDCFSQLTNTTKTCAHCTMPSPAITEKNRQFYLKIDRKSREKLMESKKISVQEWCDMEEEMMAMGRERIWLVGERCLQHIYKLFQSSDSDLLSKLLLNLGTATVDIEVRNELPPQQMHQAFFLSYVLVPPLPIRIGYGAKMEGSRFVPDERTRLLSEIMTFVEEIEKYHKMVDPPKKLQQANESNVRQLQLHVDKVYDTIFNSFAKKDGLFRMNMMGKRVNQACRSVISPDPNVEPNEVLLPRPFARSLSFPEQITSIDPERTKLLYKCVINGPDVYPGATHLEIKERKGTMSWVALQPRLELRRKTAENYFRIAQEGSADVFVYRHVLDGDHIIFNRQPTLHRPSMMGYRARVLSNLKTLRFHYVNGKSYNADFDGDEMNVHLPQSVTCRAEIDTIMDANLHYLVPTSGKPIRGLIQDHCAAGVFLTHMNPESARFFTREEFFQLLFVGLQPYLRLREFNEDFSFADFLPIPAIVKHPKRKEPLWTGKQIVSALLKFVTGTKSSQNAGVSTSGQSMVYLSKWASADGTRPADRDKPIPDEPVTFQCSELLRGVLDKAQLGPSNMSIAHAIHEIYGPHRVGCFFGIIGRILTHSLIQVGLSLGVDDCMMLSQAGPQRSDLLRQIDLAAQNAQNEGEALGIIGKAVTELTNQMIPKSLLLKYPKNHLIAMTMTGAKGSATNATQMALVLGQQTFSGERVRCMSSGKTLPCFFPFDKRGRAFGFAMGRFISGIRPGEYTIHAMAGRDGLIDTAVKTSRSGYLQRCLIKGLESLTVAWDGTVRDSDGAVVQVRYGGDGLDPLRVSSLLQFDFVHQNRSDLYQRFQGGMEEGCPPLPPHIQKELDKAPPLFCTLSLNAVEKWKSRGKNVKEEMAKTQAKYKAEVAQLTAARVERAAVDPGEAVGILAAQAAGEPSTQMTLNTFHQAGTTVSHVTEGIPRLRELLMYASVTKAAVVVHFDRVGASEVEAVNRIRAKVRPMRLSDGFAEVSRPVKWAMLRNGQNKSNKIEVHLSLLFSKRRLHQLYVDSGETFITVITAYIASLTKFARTLCRGLRGGQMRRERETGGENTDDLLQAPPGADLEDEDEVPMNLGDAKDDGNVDEDEDEFDESASKTHTGTTPMPEENRSLKRGKKSGTDGGSYDDDDEQDDEDNEESNNDDEDEDDNTDENTSQRLQKPANKKRRKEQRGEDLDAPLSSPVSINISSSTNFDNFAPFVKEYEGGSMIVSFRSVPLSQCLQAGVAPSSQPKALLNDAFAVRITIEAPRRTIAVVPDLVNEALKDAKIAASPYSVETTHWLPENSGEAKLIFQGEGAKLRNVSAILAPFAYLDTVEKALRSLKSTDMRDIAEAYGIEAAKEALDRELQHLFKRHDVNPRHTGLIADRATQRGKWQAFNFNGMISSSSSPLFQMTFASCRKFLERAVSRGISDDLRSFSAAIMVGERPRVGTGTVDCKVDQEALQGAVMECAPKALKPMKKKVAS